jgi:hypothetical protein
MPRNQNFNFVTNQNDTEKKLKSRAVGKKTSKAKVLYEKI